MTGHATFQRLLVSSGELSIADQLRLQRHLVRCPRCKDSWNIVAANRAALRTVTGLRPPEEVRFAIIEATAATRDTASFYGPVALAFLSIPITLVVITLVLNYGLVAFIVSLALLLLFSGFTALRASGCNGVPEPIAHGDAETPWRELVRSIGLDAVGTLVGGLLFFLLMLLLVALSGSQFH